MQQECDGSSCANSAYMVGATTMKLPQLLLQWKKKEVGCQGRINMHTWLYHFMDTLDNHSMWIFPLSIHFQLMDCSLMALLSTNRSYQTWICAAWMHEFGSIWNLILHVNYILMNIVITFEYISYHSKEATNHNTTFEPLKIKQSMIMQGPYHCLYISDKQALVLSQDKWR